LLELAVIAASSILGALSISFLHRNKAVTDSIDRIKGKVVLHPFESARRELESLKIERDSLADKINRVYEATKDGRIDTFERDKLILNCKEQIGLQNVRIRELEEISNYSELLTLRSDLVRLFENKISEINNKLRELSTKQIINDATRLEAIVPGGTNPDEKEEETSVGEISMGTNIQKNHRSSERNYTEENIRKIQDEIAQALAGLENSNIHPDNQITENSQLSDKKMNIRKPQKRDALSFLDGF
jgi:hypothetical protein